MDQELKNQYPLTSAAHAANWWRCKNNICWHCNCATKGWRKSWNSRPTV